MASFATSRSRRPSTVKDQAVVITSLAFSVGLLVIGLWAAVRRWDAAEGLLTAAVALSAIAYAVLTGGLLRAGREQVKALEQQVAEERITREEHRATAERAHELAQATLRETTRGQLSSQAPTVTVRLVHVRGDWYRTAPGVGRQQVPAPTNEVLQDDWPGLSMNLVMGFEVRNHGPGVAIVSVMGLLQDDALWTDDWSQYERRSKTKALPQGEVAPIALQISSSASGWWQQAREGFQVPEVEDNRWARRYTLLTSPPDHSVIDRHQWQPEIRPLDASNVLFTVRPQHEWVNAPLLWFPTREYPTLT